MSDESIKGLTGRLAGEAHDGGIDHGGYVHPFTNIAQVRGITRRDWSATEIAKGIWSDQGHIDFLMNGLDGDPEKVCQKVAEMAYRQADFLIAEGKKQ